MALLHSCLYTSQIKEEEEGVLVEAGTAARRPPVFIVLSSPQAKPKPSVHSWMALSSMVRSLS